MAEAKPDKPHQIVIHVDGQAYKVTDTSLTGAQIKAVAGKDSQYQLFLEVPGKDEDKLVNDTESIALKDGIHFYTVPPATFGAQ
jgi:hypothetical protein